MKEPSTEFIMRALNFKLDENDQAYLGYQGIAYLYQSIVNARQHSSTEGDIVRMVKENWKDLGPDNSL